MRIFICCSKHFYHQIPDIQRELERAGHVITLPNSYDNPMREEEVKLIGPTEHAVWKSDMIKRQDAKVRDNEAVLVLNFAKNGIPNYIGGATFLEMFRAWDLGKRIFLYNPIPDGILKDEICGFNPVILSRDLSLITDELVCSNAKLN